MATVSAIVVNHKRPDILGACLGSLREALAATEEATELIVVDNASGDGSCALVREVAPEAAVIELPENRGSRRRSARGSSGERRLDPADQQRRGGPARRRPPHAGRQAPGPPTSARSPPRMRFANGAGTINSAGIGADRLGIAYDRLLGQPASASESDPLPVFGLRRRGPLPAHDAGPDRRVRLFVLLRPRRRRCRMACRCAVGAASTSRAPSFATTTEPRSGTACSVLPRRPRPGADAREERQRAPVAPLQAGDGRLRPRVRRLRRPYRSHPRPAARGFQGCVNGIDTGGPEAIADRSSSPHEGLRAALAQNRVARQLGSEYGHRG